MIRGRNNGGVAFTGKQCEELEKQVLTFRYLMSGVAVPPALMSSVITSSASSNSSLFPHHQQHHLPIGSSYFQVGYGRKIDPEPGRCKRTDGKKWRCSKEAHQDSKYCEKHMHRSKSKAKKQFNALNNNNIINISPTKTAITTTSSAAVKSYSPYPAISYCPVSQCSYPNKFQPKSSTFYPFMSTQSSSSSNVSMSVRDDGTSPNWLGLDGTRIHI
ncbi:hypothetical protein RND81_01G065400 [Saponaria officinalis]|uniref:Growth-regulating factor n=1 Tax=Saponaria officinalis TaxID=3572 RepID=A0AAW1NC24_SAPOF